MANQESLAHSFSRAKFFDLIIPVVPFVSASNSYQIALETLEDVLDANDPQMINLLELVADAIPDKRTWINIHNEFIVYKEQLLNPKRTNLGLNPVNLLAILVYKNCYLDDAVKLQNGRSSLDYIYKKIREIIQNGIPLLNSEIRDLESKINKFTSAETTEDYAHKLKTTLIEILADLNQKSAENCDSISIRIASDSQNVTDAGDPKLWENISHCKETDRIKIEAVFRNPYPYPDSSVDIAPTIKTFKRIIGNHLISADGKQNKEHASQKS